MANTVFQDSFSEEIWETTYKDHNDKSVDDTLLRSKRFHTYHRLVGNKRDAAYNQTKNNRESCHTSGLNFPGQSNVLSGPPV